MLRSILTSLRALAVFTFLTGVIYPLVITLIAEDFFGRQARGSLLLKNGKPVGSELISQKNESPRYFQPRPSAGDFATVPSSASNLGPTIKALKEILEKRREKWGKNPPADLITSSGSGLDPHLSIEAAQYQVESVARARKLGSESKSQLSQDVLKMAEGPTFGVLGQSRVNVLKLNLMLDEQY